MSQKTKGKKISEPSYILKDLDKAAETALFYGFTPIKSPRVTREDLEKTAQFREEKKTAGIQASMTEIFPRPEEKTSLLRSYHEWELLGRETPLMVYFRRPPLGIGDRRPSGEYHCGLEIVGSLSSICEAIAIKTACAILAEYGHKDLVVDINSIGDKDSISRLEYELSSFIRKHIEKVPSELRPVFRKNPFEAIRSEHEDWAETKERAPKSTSCLSEQSINNFKEVLEYLEALEIPYRLVHHLVGNRQFCSHTIFEIKSAAEGEGEEEKEGTENFVFAVGARHNHFAKRVGFKRDIPVLGLNLRFRKPARPPKIFFKSKPRPKFYFIQFGTKAKLKSLAVIEALRQARIPVYHSLTSDQFVGQLKEAEDNGSPFVIIMGQKEALENTAVVRHMSTRVQETIALCDLPQYLMKLK